MTTDTRKLRRESILAAADQEFAEQGYERAKVEEIARRAGIGKSTVYEYFISKDEMFLEVILCRVNTLHGCLTAALKGKGTLREKLLRLMSSTDKMMHNTISLLVNMPNCTPALNYMHDHGHEQQRYVQTLLSDAVVQATKNGELRPDINPEYAAMFLTVLIFSAGHNPLMPMKDERNFEQAIRPDLSGPCGTLNTL